jgi:hypothetical protein
MKFAVIVDVPSLLLGDETAFEPGAYKEWAVNIINKAITKSVQDKANEHGISPNSLWTYKMSVKQYEGGAE